MEQAKALNKAIEILHKTKTQLLGNNATFTMIHNAQRYLEQQMTAELHK